MQEPRPPRSGRRPGRAVNPELFPTVTRITEPIEDDLHPLWEAADTDD